MKEGLEKQFDAYIRKTIKHTVINFAKRETKKRQREISFELLENSNFNENSSMSFSFCDKIEELFENEKLAKIVKDLPEESKRILKLKFIDNCSSKEIANIIGKSDSRVRHILNDTLKEIKIKYEVKK